MSKKILEVKNLSISFRTPNGLVRAVRDVSFDLYKGETLAIVGESGSGKSVTNRAIMGILAKNAIVDDGQINYSNQDLTKLSEANFHTIRGNKIGMIFQDPLSALNPIMRIGKQITEAMLVNGNRIKNRMQDLYHHEYHDYLNAKTAIRLARERKRNTIYEINVENELTRDEKKEKIAKLKKDVKKVIEANKAKLPALKRKYHEAKAKAKVETQKEIAAVKEEKQKTFDGIQNEINDVKEQLKKIDKSAASFKDIRAKLSNLRKKKWNNAEMFRRRFKVTKKEAYERAIKIMEEVGIPEPTIRFKQYPFQFSGGMRQRIVIAIALTANPSLLICDEPTTALDVTIQGQILNLIKDIKKQRDLSVIFITHDLGVVANMADRVAVMYAGKIVEYGNANEIFYEPRHPYTWALLSSVPDLETKGKLSAIPGTPPDMLYPPKGDAFADRNQFALEIDFEEQPPYFKITDTHYAATWLLHSNAPKIPMPKVIEERAKYYHKIVTSNKTKDNKQFQKNKGGDV